MHSFTVSQIQTKISDMREAQKTQVSEIAFCYCCCKYFFQMKVLYICWLQCLWFIDVGDLQQAEVYRNRKINRCSNKIVLPFFLLLQFSFSFLLISLKLISAISDVVTDLGTDRNLYSILFLCRYVQEKRVQLSS